MNDEDETDPICLHCGSTNLYRDESSDDLICSDCNTQSQSLSQRENAEDNEGMTTTKRRAGTVSTRKSLPATLVEDEIEEGYSVPSLLDCTEAFLSLVEIAARRSVSEDLIPKLDHVEGFRNRQIGRAHV